MKKIILLCAFAVSLAAQPTTLGTAKINQEDLVAGVWTFNGPRSLAVGPSEKTTLVLSETRDWLKVFVPGDQRKGESAPVGEHLIVSTRKPTVTQRGDGSWEITFTQAR